MITPAAASGHAIQAAPHRLSARFLAEARIALVRYLRHAHQPIELVRPVPAGTSTRGSMAISSFNWSGYADVSSTAGTFTEVSAQWKTPEVDCTAEDTITVEWVGIDGVSDQTVEQDGTLGWCFEGTPVYYTWYEMAPQPIIVVGTSLQPGDRVIATVSRSGTSYTLSVADSTHTANSFSTTATCDAATCLDTSAEWIAERPAFSIGVAPLADFGKWNLTKATETANGTPGTISSYQPNYAINMFDATVSYRLTTLSELSADGNRFTTAWNNSY